ncbi:MAG: SH3 domain-containing protein [Treponema sp.]|jgi:hypothetical protein|nr:SH3 domain-containing protein [Treponema sp.]
MNNKIFYSFILFILLLNINVFAQELEKGYPKLMYVTAKEGLRERKEPSTNSEIRRTLKYGEWIQVFSRQDKPVTINGITDYWYRSSASTFEGYQSWVFGGYLSEELPKDLPFFIGQWDDAEEIEKKGYSRVFVSFRPYPENSFAVGLKETSGVSFGTWKIKETNRNIITFEITTQFLPAFMTSETEPEPFTKFIKITIIDKDNILFEDPDEKKPTRLRRNKTGN